MDLLRELTIKNLKLNKRRTIITILGIILSVALMVTVTTMVSSVTATIRDTTIKENGNYHIKIISANGYEDNIKNNEDIESYFVNKELGYAKIDSKNDYKPYIKIFTFNEEDYKNNKISIIEGRAPKNSSEILIGEHIKHEAKYPVKIGETIKLNISDRIVDGQEVFNDFQYGLETLREKFSK